MDLRKFFFQISTLLLIFLLINDKADSQICIPLLSDCSRFSLGNFLKSAKDVTTGILGNVPNLIPTVNEIFYGSKQVLFGLPLETASTAINFFCSAALSSKAVNPRYTPNITLMMFQFRTGCKRQQVPLLDAYKLLQLEGFVESKQLVIFITGWTTNPNKSLNINALENAYHCRFDTNFIVLDAAYFIDTLYSWSAYNTEEIGRHLAVGLHVLIQHIKLENIHLIGHSLGAHIAGAAGRYFTEFTNKLLPRITGLDPARPCFNEGESLTGLSKGDAEFVDIIHSNSGILGKREPTGDADFYPGGVVPLPPGCFTIDCAHDRAWEYYVESVYPTNGHNFMSVRCNSLRKLNEGACRGKTYPMGFAAIKNIKGNFFLNVHPQSPFGEHNKNTKLYDRVCRVC